jgi:predicted Zn-dependent peptidase
MFRLVRSIASLSLVASLLIWPSVAETLDKELPSGLRVVVVENPASPTVSVNVFISAGSLDETPETTGLAHFYEHMFFRGTPTLSGLQFKKSIEDLGGSTNATTAKDMTHYFIGLPAEHAEKGLELLADALQRAEIDPEGIDVEREVVLEEYRLGENSAGRLAGDKLYKLAYGEHPYSRSTIGTKDAIKSFQRADFVKWKNDHYGPERCTVVVVGDVAPERIYQKAKQLFANWKSNGQGNRKLTEPPTAPEAPVIEEGTGPVGSTILFLGYPAPSAHDRPDVYAVDVLSFLLGQGKQSLLHRSLVKEKELAETVDVSFLTPRQRGLIIVSAVAVDKKSAEMRAALTEGIAAVVEGKFEEKDLARAKAQLIGSYKLQNESNSGAADSIGFYAALGVPGFSSTYVAEIEKVSKQSVMAAAKKYMGGGYWGYVLKPGKRGRS